MASPTYLFYDLETTGLNKSFDQILHFAAIRTTLELKELERYELKIRLNPDVVPSPYAMLTHHMSLKEIAEGISEWDAITQIHAWLNTPGTISLGYNTLGFDDEFLRFSFYRNLLAPYTHQYANQCGRMDLYPMTLMYYLFKPECILWPEEFSLKLEALNKANQFVVGRSHHAMIDVEVTLALAKAFIKEEKMWAYLLNYFQKNSDEQLTQKVCSDKKGLMVLGKLGKEHLFHAPVLYLGMHATYKKTVWLRLDLPELRKATRETLAENTQSLFKKYGEPGFILPLEERFLKHLSAERLALYQENVAWLEKHPTILQDIIHYHCHTLYPAYPNADVTSTLYGGFWTKEETHFCQTFHQISPEKKVHSLASCPSPALSTLALRVLGRHFESYLKDPEMHQFKEYLKQINPEEASLALIDYQGRSRLSPRAALSEIQEIRQKNSLNSEQNSLLKELEAYLYKQFGVCC